MGRFFVGFWMFLDFLDFWIFWNMGTFFGYRPQDFSVDLRTCSWPTTSERRWDTKFPGTQRLIGMAMAWLQLWDVSTRDAMCGQYVPLKNPSLRLNLQMLFCPLSDSYILLPLSTLMSFCPAPIVGWSHGLWWFRESNLSLCETNRFQ